MSRYTASSATSSSTCNVPYSFCNRPMHTDRTVPRSARARMHAALYTQSCSDRQRRKKRKREKEKEGRRMIARGRGDDKKKKEKKPRMRSCAFYRCGALPAKRVLVHTYVCGVLACGHTCAYRMRGRYRRTLPPLCVRLRTFAISLNPQTTSVRVGAI